MFPVNSRLSGMNRLSYRLSREFAFQHCWKKKRGRMHQDTKGTVPRSIYFVKWISQPALIKYLNTSSRGNLQLNFNLWIDLVLLVADVNECVPNNPCKNGGICRNTIGSYQCTCVGRWFTGKHCDQGKWSLQRPNWNGFAEKDLYGRHFREPVTRLYCRPSDMGQRWPVRGFGFNKERLNI